MNKKNLLWITLISVSVIGLIGYLTYEELKPGQYDAFAKCLSDKDVVMYGAFWCPHCRANKELFKSSWKHVKYIECSTPDGKGKKQICIDENIEGYPTWEYNGERKSGEQSLDVLSEWTSCPL